MAVSILIMPEFTPGIVKYPGNQSPLIMLFVVAITNLEYKSVDNKLFAKLAAEI
jgi:hypothetical protein